MISRKDDQLKHQAREIETLYGRVKKYLHMQDHLYKDFVESEKAHAEAITELKEVVRSKDEELKNAQARLNEL